MGGFGGVRVPDEADDADDPAAEPFPLACCPEGLASRPLRLSYVVPSGRTSKRERGDAGMSDGRDTKEGETQGRRGEQGGNG